MEIMNNSKHAKHFNKHRKGHAAFWAIVLLVVSFFFFKKAGFFTSIYLSTFFTWPLAIFCIAILCLLHRNWIAGIIFLAGAKFFWIPILLKADPNLCQYLSADGFVQSYWYLLVIFIAIMMIIKHVFGIKDHWDDDFECKKKKKNRHENVDGFISSEVVFGSNEKIYFNENFKGAKFETVFGSQEVDLRKCAILHNEKAIIDVSVVFGSTVIWVPAEWAVQVNTESVGSSIEDKRMQHPANGEKNTLIIEGKCVFSSLEIKS